MAAFAVALDFVKVEAFYRPQINYHHIARSTLAATNRCSDIMIARS